MLLAYPGVPGVVGARGRIVGGGRRSSAAKLLLGHPGVPGEDVCIEAERVAAVRAVEAALGALGLGGEGG